MAISVNSLCIDVCAGDYLLLHNIIYMIFSYTLESQTPSFPEFITSLHSWWTSRSPTNRAGPVMLASDVWCRSTDLQKQIHSCSKWQLSAIFVITITFIPCIQWYFIHLHFLNLVSSHAHCMINILFILLFVKLEGQGQSFHSLYQLHYLSNMFCSYVNGCGQHVYL